MTPQLLFILATSTGGLADDVQKHLAAAAQPWLTRNSRKLKKAAPKGSVEVVFEIEINRKGGFTRVRPSLGSGKKSVDKLARGLFRVTPPLRKLPASLKRSKRNTPCVIHLELRAKPRRAGVTAACSPRGAPQVSMRPDANLSPPRSDLFEALAQQSAGSFPKALAASRRATEAAPRWQLATLTHGLILGRSGRVGEAQKFLEKVIKKRRTAEAKRYLKGKGPKSTAVGYDDDEAEESESVAACLRDDAEIYRHIRARFKRLNQCVEQERRRAPTSPLPPTLPISFVITPPGRVKAIVIDHRFFREGGPLTQCVKNALTAKLTPEEGSNCPVQFDINLE